MIYWFWQRAAATITRLEQQYARCFRAALRLAGAHPAIGTSSANRLLRQEQEEKEPNNAALPDIDSPMLPPDKERILLEAIKAAFPHGRLGCTDWRPIVDAELHKRLYWFKYRYIPWIASIVPLQGAKVLEIGTGTGCSCIPLLEAGAFVTCVDISDVDLQIARLRADLHGVAERASFKQLNAAELGAAFAGFNFDLIVYFAALEHMTYAERIASLRAAWGLLKAGQFLVVCDTPNRLWYYDYHTALQNFFLWLPDEVAVDYAAKTPREQFNADHHLREPNGTTRLARWGRCLSYHEFEIAFDVDVGRLEIYDEWQHQRERGDRQWWSETWANSKDGQFYQFLRLVAPQLPTAFIEPELALMIRKPCF